jgi:hypothetical protein
MMKSLFMVWYLGGSIAITQGPLPYNMEECETRAKEVLAEILEKDKEAEFLSLELKCEYHAERPTLGN